MKITVRSVRDEDSVFINQIRTMDGVRETTLGLLSDRIDQSANTIKELKDNSHILVAEIKENDQKKVIGVVSLALKKNPRARHVGKIIIMVNEHYQRNGVGKELLKEIIDLADNWLMLVRLELTVFADDINAVKLYESFGFEIEGTLRHAAIKNGKYDDLYTMARINKNMIK